MDEEYKLKRERNNESVKRCRENEKKKIEAAQTKLDEYKKENKLLESKYASLQKELSVLKSLFIQSTSSGTTASSSSSSAPSTSDAIVINDSSSQQSDIKNSDT